MKRDFKKITVKEFNFTFGTELKEGMGYDEAMDTISDSGLKTWYDSLTKKEVVQDINDNEKVLKRLSLWLSLDCYFITGLRIYIALI